MIVITDTNENSTAPNVVHSLREKYPDLIISNLAGTEWGGDVHVILDDGKRLVVERKDINDFLNSIADGRMYSQVERMASADFSAVIVVGSLGYTRDDFAIANGEVTKWHGASVRGVLYSIQFSGCPVLFCNDSWYPRFIENLANFIAKPPVHWQSRYKRIVTFPPLDDVTDLIANIPFPTTGSRRDTVGVECARSLIEFATRQGSINLAEALSWGTALELIDKDLRPKGWGKKTIQKFRDAMGLKSGEYLTVKDNNQDATGEVKS